MPRYFFHLIGDEPPLIDANGIELPDVEAARMSAVFEAREIMKAGLFEGCLPLHLRFDITDKAGNVLMTVPFEKTVKVQRREQSFELIRDARTSRSRRAGVRTTHCSASTLLAGVLGAVGGMILTPVEPSLAVFEQAPTAASATALGILASLAWLRSQLQRY